MGVDYGSMGNEINVNPAQMSTIQGSDLRFSFRLDKAGMLRLSRRLRGTFAARRALGAALFFCLVATNQSAAYSYQKPYNVMNIKLYAYNKLNWNDFQCYNWLIHYESRWNYKARNGSHYGLGQMRSKWYGTLSPYKQIDVHLDYIKHRYNGKPCKALAHWENKGWH